MSTFKTYDVSVLGIDNGNIIGFVLPDSGLLIDLKKDCPIAQIRKDDFLATPATHHRKDLDGKKALVWSNKLVMRQFNYTTQEFEIVE
jgi:hypothetical protein